MGKIINRTAIEWTDVTYNFQYGCREVSRACNKCYAKSIAYRFKNLDIYKGLTERNDVSPGRFVYDWNRKIGVHWTGKLNVRFERPEKIKKLRNLPPETRVFIGSMTDLLYGDKKHVEKNIKHLYAICEAYPHLIFQILTKRSDMLVCKFFPSNLHVGVTVERNKYLYRIDDLRDSNANIKFVSFEPLLEPLPMSDLDLIGIVLFLF